MFINLSNHPSTVWDKTQFDAVPKDYGEIVDIPFPSISPESTAEEIVDLAKLYYNQIENLTAKSKAYSAVHLMGETVFVYALATMLIKSGYAVLASTTNREVEYDGDRKISTFRFVRFRQFPSLDMLY